MQTEQTINNLFAEFFDKCDESKACVHKLTEIATMRLESLQGTFHQLQEALNSTRLF